jgi:tRNA1Val (adenine37-N6)-methyltransferase
MPNDYFQFKQFIIHQDRCAMKVSTEACILGGWFGNQHLQHKTVLDIGSGTGLLMLMLAQKWPGKIHGIEIDSEAAAQLKENIRLSPWNEKCLVFNGDIRGYTLPVVYDFIISNPPFYEKQLASPSNAVNLARHSSLLTLEELLKAIDVNLSNTGSFGIILPKDRAIYFEKLSIDNGFCLIQKLHIRHSPAHAPFRTVMHFSRKAEKPAILQELVIRDREGIYTDEFTGLLKDYYLYL